MQRISYLLARILGFAILAVSAITTGVHTTQIQGIETNRARYDALEQRIASDKSALIESSELTPGAGSGSDGAKSNTGKLDRSHSFTDQQAAELELGQHSSKAEEGAYLQMSSYHSLDDLGLGIGIILLAAGLAEGLYEVPEG